MLPSLLRASGTSFRANDNISASLLAGDIDRIEADVAQAIRALLDALVIDHESDHNTCGTPERVARMLVREVFSGRYLPRPEPTAFVNIRHVDQIDVVGPIAVRSCCAHHLVPIIGEAWIGVVADPASLIGLSKHHRLIEWVFARPQIQEEAVEQAADVIAEAIGNPTGVGVVVRARHLCCSWRGVRDANSLMTSSVMRGLFRTNPDARRELLSLIEGMGYR